MFFLTKSILIDFVVYLKSDLLDSCFQIFEAISYHSRPLLERSIAINVVRSDWQRQWLVFSLNSSIPMPPTLIVRSDGSHRVKNTIVGIRNLSRVEQTSTDKISKESAECSVCLENVSRMVRIRLQEVPKKNFFRIMLFSLRVKRVYEIKYEMVLAYWSYCHSEELCIRICDSPSLVWSFII